MKTRGYLLALVALVGLLSGGPAFAAYDTGTSQYVTAGRNTGEHRGWTEIYFHAATGAIGYGTQRTHDAQGIAITSELGNNTQTYSASGTTTPCLQHGVSSVRFASKAELGSASSIDFEKELMRTGCLPGRYLLSITKGADTISLSREYNSDVQAYTVNMTFLSSANVPAVGVTIKTIQPYASTVGTTDASGRITAQLAPGWYRIELNNNVTWRTYSNYLMYVGDIPGQGTVAKSFVATPIGDPAMSSYGGLRVQVNESTNNTALSGVQVQVGGSIFYTGADGACWVGSLPAATYTVTAGKTGYNAQTTTKTVSAGSVANVTLSLDPAGSTGPGGGGDEPEGFPDLGQILTPEFWADLFTYLFVPSDTTLTEWDTLRGEIAAWGPFGAVNDFFYAWNNPIWVAGGDGRFIELEIWYATDSHWSGGVDLRPLLAEGDPNYVAHPESRGTHAGTFLAGFRTLEGVFVWCIFLIAVFHWARPRFQT